MTYFQDQTVGLTKLFSFCPSTQVFCTMITLAGVPPTLVMFPLKIFLPSKALQYQRNVFLSSFLLYKGTCAYVYAHTSMCATCTLCFQWSLWRTLLALSEVVLSSVFPFTSIQVRSECIAYVSHSVWIYFLTESNQ